MAKEIERKFLVRNDDYRLSASHKIDIMQAYISDRIEATVRVRIAGESAFLTVKGRTTGAVRDEWEYPIPFDDAMEMIRSCSAGPAIDKTRYHVGPWEIDEFHGALEGLVVAEIELDNENQEIELPDFIGREVTGDARYYNSSLAKTENCPPTC